jgi:hypothetical protein
MNEALSNVLGIEYFLYPRPLLNHPFLTDSSVL